MRISPILLLLVTMLAGCASNPRGAGGNEGTEMRQVSVSALLSRAGEFDGQAVRVLGVASFPSGSKGRPALYATADDERRSTDSFVEIGSLSPALSTAEGALEKLSGTPVVVEGIFHAKPLNKLPQRPGAVVVCVGDCRTSGVLEDITRVSAQVP
jgi:hypothetical protein